MGCRQGRECCQGQPAAAPLPLNPPLGPYLLPIPSPQTCALPIPLPPSLRPPVTLTHLLIPSSIATSTSSPSPPPQATLTHLPIPSSTTRSTPSHSSTSSADTSLRSMMGSQLPEDTTLSRPESMACLQGRVVRQGPRNRCHKRVGKRGVHPRPPPPWPPPSTPVHAKA